ncbi:ead/Ea22-like family protein [Enterobacter kobei]|uniref:ead/Ea22-like family protein n=1 Tax=Enterobacter kobei TaxID=208224 RepID=UPI002149A065|nr:ead/Ea22-like family protein [Enterobacter kobei]MCR2795478.1 ead/Ea22-like family protein [Enterobacter kobei]
MSNIDKQALREAAERAESDSWGYDRDEFNEALTPSTVLALLDELEAAEKRIAEQNKTLMASRSYVKSHAAGDGHAFGVLQAIDRAAGIGVKGE